MTTAAAVPQCMIALEKANHIRLGAAEHRRWITEGRLSVVQVLDPERSIPEVLRSTPIMKLLTAQHRWGRRRAQRLLREIGIGELRRLDALTRRERAVLVARLHVSA